MLLALASSPLPWTGAGALGVVGYSLGGGVAVHFAAAFPALVARLVLLAPAGLIRRAKFGPLTRFLFTAGLVPDRLLAPLTARRLKRPIAAGIRKPPPPSARDIKDHHHLLYVQDALAEASDPPSAAASETSIEKAVLRYVEWMVAHHAGFVPAFIGCVRGAPLYDQHATFAKLAARPPGSTLVVLGAADEIVAADEYERDALPLLGGRERVRWVVVDAGHDLPMTRAAEVLEAICNAWGLFQRPDAA